MAQFVFITQRPFSRAFYILEHVIHRTVSPNFAKIGFFLMRRSLFIQFKSSCMVLADRRLWLAAILSLLQIAVHSDDCVDPSFPALGGIDVVEYRALSHGAAHAVMGLPSFERPWGGYTFWFKNEANAETFAADAARFFPAWGGFDAWGVAAVYSWHPHAMGPQGDPHTWAVVEDRLYLFKSCSEFNIFLFGDDGGDEPGDTSRGGNLPALVSQGNTKWNAWETEANPDYSFSHNPTFNTKCVAQNSTTSSSASCNVPPGTHFSIEGVPADVPSPGPTMTPPSPAPTRVPTPQPSFEPTPFPSPEPTRVPSPLPSLRPTPVPSPLPSLHPSIHPVNRPHHSSQSNTSIVMGIGAAFTFLLFFRALWNHTCGSHRTRSRREQRRPFEADEEDDHDEEFEFTKLRQEQSSQSTWTPELVSRCEEGESVSPLHFESGQ